MDIIDLRRSIGYVVQNIGLFPHMTIERNVATVPTLLGWDDERKKKRVRELLNLVQLPADEFAQRFPKQLSGGQQQRVGVARALAAHPPFVLFDEPFGALDAITRMDLQKEIKALHKRLNSAAEGNDERAQTTFLFVTHDISEAFYLGTRVMIMDDGAISQFDTPENIIANPETEFVRNLLDTVNQQNSMWGALDE